jgi:hypothetical protein
MVFNPLRENYWEEKPIAYTRGGYDKNAKEHSCKVEVLWDGMA